MAPGRPAALRCNAASEGHRHGSGIKRKDVFALCCGYGCSGNLLAVNVVVLVSFEVVAGGGGGCGSGGCKDYFFPLRMKAN